MKNFSRLASHPKMLIGSKLSLGYQEIKFSSEEPDLVCVGVYNRSRRISIIGTYKKPNMVPPKRI
jgi:hypothetical protein